LSSSACCFAVRTCAVCGTFCFSSETSCASETPGFAATEISEYPSRSSSRWAVGIEKTAIVAPPSDSTFP
jgi:hypothetical protein